jgi:AraC family transcriptional regulator, transcriptional activator of pobA
LTKTTPTFAGARSPTEIPRYFLYGDDKSAGTWFVNVEPLAKRCRETNWYIAPHSHAAFSQIVLVRSGSGTMMADEHKIAFESPCALIVPIHVVHGFKYAEDSDGWVLTLTEAYQRTLLSRALEFEPIWKNSRVLSLADAPNALKILNEALLHLDTELDEGAPGAVVAAEAYLSTVLVTLLRQIGAQSDPAAPAPRGHGAIVTQFKDMLERRYREGWSPARFADELNVSLADLRSACLSVIGETPIKIIQDRIIVEARRNLIYSDLSIAQIAYWLGFDDPSYFSRFFTKQTGERPASFRQSQKYGINISETKDDSLAS